MAVLLVLSAAAAMAINGWLWYRHAAGGTLAGCGGGPCGELLASRWSQLFRLPVAGCGVAVYLFMLGSLAANRPRLLGMAGGGIGGAALWFGFVQAVILGRFCPWCMTAHGLGLVAVVLGIRWRVMAEPPGEVIRQTGFWATAAFLGLGLGQVYGPLPATHRFAAVTDAEAAPVHERGRGPKAAFVGGWKTYDVGTLPHLGKPTAKRVIVEYFDYTCAACATMKGFLAALQRRYPDDVCVIVLPVPMESPCNPRLDAGDAAHPGSCEIARLGMAIWRVRPDQYGGLHDWLVGGRSPAEVRAKALSLMGEDELAAALRDPWIDELFQANIRDWHRFAGRPRKLPLLLVTGSRVLHGLPSGEEDFLRAMAQELGL